MMRTLGALVSGIVLIGLLVISLGVRSYGGPYFDPKCGEPCAEQPGSDLGHVQLRPLPNTTP